MAADARDGQERSSSREFTVIRKDLEGLGRPPTQEEIYPLRLLEFGLFGLPSPAPFPKSNREALSDRNKEGGA